ncbi:hypothetical protein AVEN_184633-1, partial [Araneus ventricosus]
VVSRTAVIDVAQYEALKKNNETLRQKLDELLKITNELQDAEIRLQKKDSEVQQLKQELSDKQLLCANLDDLKIHSNTETNYLDYNCANLDYINLADYNSKTKTVLHWRRAQM